MKLAFMSAWGWAIARLQIFKLKFFKTFTLCKNVDTEAEFYMESLKVEKKPQ